MRVSAPLRVLIADDHAAYRSGLARAVDACDGLELVGAATDGAEALRLAIELLPDLALLDVRMPELNGFEVARRLRDQATTTVVMLSGGNIAALEQATRDAGAAEVLSKALPRDEICRRLLSRRSAG